MNEVSLGESMEKILVSLMVPAVEECYDILLPPFLTVEEILDLLVKALAEITRNRYVSSGAEVLCNAEYQIIYDKKNTIEECRICNGDTLIII